MSISLNNIESRVTALEKIGFVKYPDYNKFAWTSNQKLPTSNTTISDNGWLLLWLSSGDDGNTIYVNDMPMVGNYFHSGRDNDTNSSLIPCYPGMRIRARKNGASYNIILNLYYKFKEVISYVNLLK